MFDKTAIWSILIYGLIVLSFGCLGYINAGSKASLWSGLVFGSLLIVSAAALFSKRFIGAYIALGSTVLLTGVFSYRYSLSGKALSASLAVLSGAMLLFLLLRFVKLKSN